MPLQETLKHLQADLCQSHVGSQLHPWVLLHTRFFCALQESLFPPVLWNFCNQIPLTSKVRFPEDSQSICQIPWLRSLLWSLKLLQQCKNFFCIIVLQFVDHPPRGSVVGLMVTSFKRTYTSYYGSQDCCYQCPCPCSRPLLTHASIGGLQTLTDRSDSLLWGITAPFPGS